MTDNHTQSAYKPEPRFMLKFSTSSLAKYSQEYAAVRKKLRRWAQSPETPFESRSVLRHLLQNEFNGNSYLSMRPVMSESEWIHLSRAMRDFRTDNYQPREYQYVSRAYRRRVYL